MQNRGKYTSLLAFILIVLLFVSMMPNSVIADDTEQQVKDKLARILASEEFKEESSAFMERLADQIKDVLEYIKEKLSSMRPKAKGGSKPGYISKELPVVDTFVSDGIILGILALIGVLLHKEFYKSRQIAAQHNELLVKLQNKPDEVKQRIQELYEQQHFREAFRYTYLALLIDLNKMGFLRIDKSKTNRQYMRELRASGYKSYDTVRSFTDAFNEYWYGKKELSKEVFEGWQTEYHSLQREEKL